MFADVHSKRTREAHARDMDDRDAKRARIEQDMRRSDLLMPPPAPRAPLFGGRVGPSSSIRRSNGPYVPTISPHDSYFPYRMPDHFAAGLDLRHIDTERDAVDYRQKSDPALYAPDGTIIYVNISLPGPITTAAEASSDTEPNAILAVFDESFSQVIMRRPSDYRVAIVHATVPMSSVPLFNYPVGSCQIGISYTYTVSGVTSVWTNTQTVFGDAPNLTTVGPNPAANFHANILTGFQNGSIAIYNVQDFLDAVNAAINAAVTLLYIASSTTTLGSGATSFWNGTGATGTVAGVVTTTVLAPYVSFNSATGLFSISYEQTAWQPFANATAGWTGAAVLYFNDALYYRFFNTFQVAFIQSNFSAPFSMSAAAQPITALWNSPFDVALALNQNSLRYIHPTEGPQQVLQTSGTLTQTGGVATWTNPPVSPGLVPGQLVSISGCSSATNLNGTWLVLTVNNAPNTATFTFQVGGSSTTAATGTPTATSIPFGPQVFSQINNITQESPSVTKWDDVVILQLQTQSIPVRPEYVPSQPASPAEIGGNSVPLGAGLGGTASGTQQPMPQMSLQNLLVEINPHVDYHGGGTYPRPRRDFVKYATSSDYGLVWRDLIGDNAQLRIDVTVVWFDRLGNRFAIVIQQGEIFQAELIFRHRGKV